MIKMKKNTITVIFLFSYLAIAAQDNKVGISFLQNYSTFRYIGSDGKKDALNYTIKFGYGLSFQKSYERNFFLEGLLLYNNKGAESTVYLDQLDWSFHYINTRINLGHNFVFGRLYPNVGCGIYFGRLLKADQYIGSAHYDLMAINAVKRNDFGIDVFGGMEYGYSDNGSVFLRLNESIGLLQLEEGDAGQKMFNRTFSVQIGLLFPIK